MSGADLGHPLQLGIELPVSAADPGAAVRLARRAEELGLDLVVVADGTDDGGALDAWTVLGAVAGATGR